MSSRPRYRHLAPAAERLANPEKTVSRAPLQLITHGQQRQVIRYVLASLSSGEESIITSRFGIDGIEKMTLMSIGQKMNISKERVRQLEKKAMRNNRS